MPMTFCTAKPAVWKAARRARPPRSSTARASKTGADAREMVGFDAGRRVKGRKRHLVTDMLGLMLRIEVHSAGVQDRDGAALVLDRITRHFPFIERFFADAGYQGRGSPRPRRARYRPSNAPIPVSLSSPGDGSSNGLRMAMHQQTPRQGLRTLLHHCASHVPDRHNQAHVPADRQIQGLLSHALKEMLDLHQFGVHSPSLLIWLGSDRT